MRTRMQASQALDRALDCDRNSRRRSNNLPTESSHPRSKNRTFATSLVSWVYVDTIPSDAKQRPATSRRGVPDLRGSAAGTLADSPLICQNP